MNLVSIARDIEISIAKENKIKANDQEYWETKVKSIFQDIDLWLKTLVDNGFAKISEIDQVYLEELEERTKDGTPLYPKNKQITLLGKKEIRIIDQGIDIIGGFGRIDMDYGQRTIMIILLEKKDNAKDENWILRERYKEIEQSYNKENFEKYIAQFLEETNG
jgi:hypothetical protein